MIWITLPNDIKNLINEYIIKEDIATIISKELTSTSDSDTLQNAVAAVACRSCCWILEF